MKSFRTSFHGLFEEREGASSVARIEIPMIQRDYAQGRDSDSVTRIRERFLDALFDALTTESNMSLDFVYGDVNENDKTLRPLDGQQRLTTLFLLHWYLAWRSRNLASESGWKRFEYATRPSARTFCKCLVESTPAHDQPLRAWLEDQHWFLYSWNHDPTIQSMLVMLEAIDRKFSGADCVAAWRRLVDRASPAITFQLLPIKQNSEQPGEDLYIKMNSRGKPLTAFENFKARFEQMIERSAPARVDEFATKVDGVWADMLWPHRGEDNIVDDEFMRYFRFVSEVCAWLGGVAIAPDDEALGEAVYGDANPDARANVDFLVRSLDAWAGVDSAELFRSWFTTSRSDVADATDDRVALFEHNTSSVDLFAACGHSKERSNSLTLLLYAALLHRLHPSEDFASRVRVVRNLVEASGSEIRGENMPALLADVRRIVVEGTLDGVDTFNKSQVDDERAKLAFATATPRLAAAVRRLENHPLLRGSLVAFEFDEAVFERRAQAFFDLFADASVLPTLTGALLAAGNYARRTSDWTFVLGSPADVLQWRNMVLTGRSRDQQMAVREALGAVLDAVAARDGSVQSALDSMIADWLERHDAATGRDWRWYLVKYPSMRAGYSGRYVSARGRVGFDFDLCMLEKKAMHSYYRDPYLSAIRALSGASDKDVRGSASRSGGPWFTGSEAKHRWMQFAKSACAVRVRDEGFELRGPSSDKHEAAFARVRRAFDIGDDLVLRIPRITVDAMELDAEDRVELGAKLVGAMIEAGL